MGPEHTGLRNLGNPGGLTILKLVGKGGRSGSPDRLRHRAPAAPLRDGLDRAIDDFRRRLFT